ncbi:hypothetical protein AB1Y20_004167 [Prymnesium parvum]|uniref:Uncharacterized protein n=1 Tax=Prymnesium parvum TaxID=97485 RepID=A0AB34J6X8_PRYPA
MIDRRILDVSQPLDGATVVWCAVRPLAGRRLSMQLLQSIRRSLPAGRKVKLLLAGFELPPSAPAELRAGYLFACADAAPPLDKFGQRQVEPPPSADLNELGVSQLYGGPTGGPSVVLEYEVRAESDSDLEPASTGEKENSGGTGGIEN